MDYLILCVAALLAGAQNSLAGGGTLYTFPSLEQFVPAVVANGTSTVALIPGSLAGAWGFRAELKPSRRWLVWLVPPSLIGGAVGTLLVTRLPESYFRTLIPWLILVATVLFLMQPWVSKWTGAAARAEPHKWVAVGVVLFQFLVAVYGGYFGAGIGILMISSLSMMGLGDLHRVNALKTLLAVCMNGVSVLIFAYDRVVRWDLALPMAVASVVGGYLGARFARRLDKRLLRWLVIAIGFGLTAYYFAKQAKWVG